MRPAPSRSTSSCSSSTRTTCSSPRDAQPSNTRAGNINTIDEVPGLELVHQPHRRGRRAGGAARPRPQLGHAAGAGASGCCSARKSAGTNPGFTARDANGRDVVPAVRRAGIPGRQHRRGRGRDASSSGRSATTRSRRSSRRSIRRASIIDPKATVKRPSGARTPFTRDDIDARPRAGRAQRRRHLSRVGRPAASGQVLGPFRYSGPAPTIPNDLVPHRAPPRAARAARLRRVDEPRRLEGRQHARRARQRERPHSVIKHYLQDVGSTFGMANNPHEWDMGWEYFYDARSDRTPAACRSASP